MFNKKGYFFMADGMIALVVLISGLVIIGTIFAGEPIFRPPYNIGQDLLSAMSTTNVSGLSLDIKPSVRYIFDAGAVEINSTSILQQAGKFYYEYCDEDEDIKLDYARNISKKFLQNIVPNPYYAELTFAGELKCATSSELIFTNFPSPTTLLIKDSQEKARTLMVTEKILFGNINYGDIFGPYTVTLKIWR